MEALANYIEPYSQPALNGELGLTATDIAKSLGVQIPHVREKIKRLQETLKSQAIFAQSTLRLCHPLTNKMYNEPVLNTTAAKYVVVTWKNKIGIAYFSWLMYCEHIAQTKVPELMSEIETLKMKLAEFEKPKIKIASENNKMVRVEVKNLAYVQKGLFGNEVQIITETKKLSELTREEAIQYSFDHKVKVKAGLSRSLNEALENGDVITVAVPKPEEPKLLN